MSIQIERLRKENERIRKEIGNFGEGERPSAQGAPSSGAPSKDVSRIDVDARAPGMVDEVTNPMGSATQAPATAAAVADGNLRSAALDRSSK
jgi:hypothetical protein